MNVQVGTICTFCKKPMSIQSSPHFIFDLEKEKLIGLAHTACTYKAKLDWYASSHTKWGEKYPTEEQIRFGCKIAKAIQQLRAGDVSSDEFHLRILLYGCLWKTNSPQECLDSNRVNELFDWWVQGSKQMSLERAKRLRNKLKSSLNNR